MSAISQGEEKRLHQLTIINQVKFNIKNNLQTAFVFRFPLFKLCNMVLVQRIM